MNCKKFLLVIGVIAAMAEVISSQPEQVQPELLSEQESDSVGPAQSQDNAEELEELPSIQRSRRQAVYGWWQQQPTTNNQRCYYYYFYVGSIRYWYYLCYNARNEQVYYYAPVGTPQLPAQQVPRPPAQQPQMPASNYGNKFKNFWRRKFGA